MATETVNRRGRFPQWQKVTPLELSTKPAEWEKEARYNWFESRFHTAYWWILVILLKPSRWRATAGIRAIACRGSATGTVGDDLHHVRGTFRKSGSLELLDIETNKILVHLTWCLGDSSCMKIHPKPTALLKKPSKHTYLSTIWKKKKGGCD